MKIVLYFDHDSDNSSMSRNSEAQLQVQKCRPDLFFIFSVNLEPLRADYAKRVRIFRLNEQIPVSSSTSHSLSPIHSLAHTRTHMLAHTLSFIELCEIALGHLSRWPGYGSQPCLNCNLKQMTFTANHCDSELNKNQNGVRIWSFSPLSSLTHVHALSRSFIAHTRTHSHALSRFRHSCFGHDFPL